MSDESSDDVMMMVEARPSPCCLSHLIFTQSGRTQHSVLSTALCSLLATQCYLVHVNSCLVMPQWSSWPCLWWWRLVQCTPRRQPVAVPVLLLRPRPRGSSLCPAPNSAAPMDAMPWCSIMPQLREHVKPPAQRVAQRARQALPQNGRGLHGGPGLVLVEFSQAFRDSLLPWLG